MNYKEARNYLNSASSRGIVLGLENIKRLCAALGNPQDGLRIVHIAGTNGKGSTGAFIESVLRCAGFKTGRFSSPAVFDYTEQWQINGENISEELFARYTDKIRRAAEAEGLCPTPFEIETALAFLLFRGEQCDICVIEVGMGGINDATNIINKSLASVITPIARDHAAFLGGSIEEIAAAKAGIIKHGGVVVTAPQSDAVMDVINNTVSDKNARLTIADTNTDYEISLAGAYQRQNAALAAAVCRQLDGVSEENIKDGLKSAVWRGRFEKICDKPAVIIDGAHNPHGARALLGSIRLCYNGRKIIYITGVFADKDYEKIAEITAPAADKIYTVTPPPPRGLSSGVYAEAIRKFNENVEAVTLDKAVRLSLEEEDAVIIVFGSLSFLGGASEKVREISAERRYSKILHDTEFLELLEKIGEAEENRIYCRHGIEHLMDVARAGYIINLEAGLNIPKEIVYGAALMHDIGRWAQYTGVAEHHLAGAEAAERILPRCGYSKEETALIADAVRKHRSGADKTETLSDVIAEADNRTRMCNILKASNTCKWAMSDRNINTVI